MGRSDYSGVSEQRRASRHRYDDALVLKAGARWRGALYLGGYAVECLLKSQLMQIHGCRKLEEVETFLPSNRTVFTHELSSLVKLIGVWDRLRDREDVWKEFNLVNRWVPAWRYNPDPSNADEAGAYLDAVKIIMNWVEKNT